MTTDTSREDREARPWLPDGAEIRRSGEAILAQIKSLLGNVIEEVQGSHPPITDVMSRNVRTCRDDDTLEVAARILWEGDCGCVPVVGSSDPPRVLGMLTDRDICMAAYTTGRRLSEIRAAEARSRQAWCVPSTATIADALAIMSLRRVHRLPVVDAEGGLIGLLSLVDVAARGQRLRAWSRLADDPVASAFIAIRTPRS